MLNREQQTMEARKQAYLRERAKFDAEYAETLKETVAAAKEACKKYHPDITAEPHTHEWFTAIKEKEQKILQAQREQEKVEVERLLGRVKRLAIISRRRQLKIQAEREFGLSETQGTQE